MRCYTWVEAFISGTIAPEAGDMLMFDVPVSGQWPPDGKHLSREGKVIEPLIFFPLDINVPALVISVEERHYAYRMIVLHKDRVWWIPASRFMNKCNRYV